MNYENFEVYGGHTNVYGGHNKFTFSSINAFPIADGIDGTCCRIETTQQTNFIPGYVDGYYNNICIQLSYANPESSYEIQEGCDPNNLDPKTLIISHDNIVFNRDAQTSVQCNSQIFNEESWQQLNFDSGTQSYILPSNEQIISWARKLLNIPVSF